METAINNFANLQKKFVFAKFTELYEFDSDYKYEIYDDHGVLIITVNKLNQLNQLNFDILLEQKRISNTYSYKGLQLLDDDINDYKDIKIKIPNVKYLLRNNINFNESEISFDDVIKEISIVFDTRIIKKCKYFRGGCFNIKTNANIKINSNNFQEFSFEKFFTEKYDYISDNVEKNDDYIIIPKLSRKTQYKIETNNLKYTKTEKPVVNIKEILTKFKTLNFDEISEIEKVRVTNEHRLHAPEMPKSLSYKEREEFNDMICGYYEPAKIKNGKKINDNRFKKWFICSSQFFNLFDTCNKLSLDVDEEAKIKEINNIKTKLKNASNIYATNTYLKYTDYINVMTDRCNNFFRKNDIKLFLTDVYDSFVKDNMILFLHLFSKHEDLINYYNSLSEDDIDIIHNIDNNNLNLYNDCKAKEFYNLLKCKKLDNLYLKFNYMEKQKLTSIMLCLNDIKNSYMYTIKRLRYYTYNVLRHEKDTVNYSYIIIFFLNYYLFNKITKYVLFDRTHFEEKTKQPAYIQNIINTLEKSVQ